MTDAASEAAHTARASVEVAVDAGTAFKVFSEEIGTWWARGPANFYDGARAVSMRFEPGVGGRYLEVYGAAPDEVLEIGRISEWEPGKRLSYDSLLDDTHVEITFVATGSATRVTVEHSVIPDGPIGKAKPLSGWQGILGWMKGFAETGIGNGQVSSVDLPRLSPLLYYGDLDEAASWLQRVFGLIVRGLLGEGNGPTELAELALGDSVVMCRRSREPSAIVVPERYMVWAYVDDLDAHYEHAVAAGAAIVEQISQHGDRTYVADDLGGHRWTFAQARPTQRLGATTW